MSTRSALATVLPLFLSSALLSPLAEAQGPDTGAAWGQLLRATTTDWWNAPPFLYGDLRPIVGKTATIGLRAMGFTQASLLIGAEAHTGVPLQLGAARLMIYVPQPMVVLPMALQSGYAKLSLPIPNNQSLIGVDVAMQAVTTSTSATALTNLLVGNLGTRTVVSALIDYRFKGTADAEKRASGGFIYSGDVEDQGVSIPVYTSVAGGGEYLWLTVIADRALTHCIELRTGTDGGGELLGQLCRQNGVLNVRIPAGSPGGPVQLYLHNTDPGQGVGLTWSIGLY